MEITGLFVIPDKALDLRLDGIPDPLFLIYVQQAVVYSHEKGKDLSLKVPEGGRVPAINRV